MSESVYTMRIEKPQRTITQHPFHLGTIFKIAEKLVLEKLNADHAVISIALWHGDKLVRFYDFRDRKEYRQ